MSKIWPLRFKDVPFGQATTGQDRNFICDCRHSMELTAGEDLVMTLIEHRNNRQPKICQSKFKTLVLPKKKKKKKTDKEYVNDSFCVHFLHLDSLASAVSPFRYDTDFVFEWCFQEVNQPFCSYPDNTLGPVPDRVTGDITYHNRPERKHTRWKTNMQTQTIISTTHIYMELTMPAYTSSAMMGTKLRSATVWCNTNKKGHWQFKMRRYTS